MPICLPQQCLALVNGHRNMGTRAVSVAYTLQPDPPPWTLPEQGISRGWEPIHKHVFPCFCALKL